MIQEINAPAQQPLSRGQPLATGKIPQTMNACCTYDFTMFDTDNVTVHDLRATLKDISKNYAFQLEKGEQTGILHYQGRMSLKIKKRLHELKAILDDKGWTKYHLSVTSAPNRGNNFYVTKDETRVSGPYTDENDTNVYIPRHIRKIKTLYQWQELLKSYLKTDDDRLIDVLYDPSGNKGKSTLIQILMLDGTAELLPFVNDYKDLMRMAYDVGPKQLYLIDMPRAMSKDKLLQFYSAVETLKSGYCYDDRYKFQKRLFDRPRICIFTNTIPDTSLLSPDMWKMWTINSKLELVDFDLTNDSLPTTSAEFSFDATLSDHDIVGQMKRTMPRRIVKKTK